MSRTALVVRHTERGSLGLLEAPLTRGGLTPVLWDVYREDAPPARLDAFDAMIVLGGAMNPDDDPVHPWLGVERAAIGDALALGLPFLGICLGAQLLSQAAGGEAPRAGTAEVGWLGVHLEEAAADDPLFGGLPTPLTTFHWHAYACEPPATATRLATTQHALQAFRVGESAWGVQFHAEVGEELADLWARRGTATLATHGLGVDDVVAGATRHAGEQRRTSEAFAAGFAAAVR